ncbi:MAG: heavy metal translocating P-type ATPase [Eubacterium sp.]|nr:heavy metal translocating P-type ATPase [Eubacterium sp.]
MKFFIKSDIKGRIRVHMNQRSMSYEEADTLQYYLEKKPGVISATVYERTADVAVVYGGDRAEVIDALARYHCEDVTVPAEVLETSGRALTAKYRDKLIMKVVFRYSVRFIVPRPIRYARIILKSLRYIAEGLKCLVRGRIEVPVLDATAIAVSIVRRDFSTAGSVMFLLGVGELLEEWTHKKSVEDLARSMSLHVNNVWLKSGDTQVLVKTDTVQPGDEVVIRMGNVVPFDGIVVDGEAFINQSSLTGESAPVHKRVDSIAYAGTVVEEGEITVRVTETKGATKYEKIVAMIENSEKLKSEAESRSAHLADALVPYTFLATGLVYALTRNVTKMLSVLMVDFSCALKLAIPISVLSAIRESNEHGITVKGGKFMESVALADVIVFDKTGTLTKAVPRVARVIAKEEGSEDEMLRIAACLEEHFPHSMANAVVNAAKEKGIEHDEMHSKVNYIVAHGIASSIGEKRVVIGSYHFVFEDEECTASEEFTRRINALPPEFSFLYLAIDKDVVSVICIEDPLRKEAPDVIRKLKESGVSKVVMMTGDSDKTAASIAAQVGVDEYYSEVMPEDKAGFVEKEKLAGHRVMMIGDGINDSPALSAADVGVAISDGAQIAREIADITIAADDLNELLTLRRISQLLMKRIDGNFKKIVGLNSAFILMGVGGIIAPSTSATLHNTSTLLISLDSMRNLIDETAES